METALAVKNLSYVFPDGAGINDVSFQIMRGDIYFLYGSHGAGKTVVLQALVGTITAQAGTIKLFGNLDFSKEQKRFGYVPQNPHFIGRMTISEMLHYFALSYGVLDSKIESVLELNLKEKKPVCRLSVFAQRKVNLAIALLGKPDLMLMDEPFFGLDAHESEQLLSIIEFLNERRNTTFLLTGHSCDLASQIATKYGVIKDGHFLTELTPATLSEKCERCIKIRTPQVPKAIPILKKEFPQFEVLADNLIRVFCPSSSSSNVNSLLVSAGIEVSEIWIAGMEPQAYLSELAGGGVTND